MYLYASINGKESPLNLRVAMYEVFLGSYNTLKNDHMVTCKCKKNKMFPLQFCEIFIFSDCLKNHFM